MKLLTSTLTFVFLTLMLATTAFSTPIMSENGIFTANGDVTFTMGEEKAAFKDINALWLWNPDTDEMLNIFVGLDSIGTSKTFSFNLNTVSDGTDSMEIENGFGFALKSPDFWFYSDSSKNENGYDHFQFASNMIGIEDLPEWKSDGDYNDMYVSWKGDMAPVPEPTTFMLFGVGLLGLSGIGRKKFTNQS